MMAQFLKTTRLLKLPEQSLKSGPTVIEIYRELLLTQMVQWFMSMSMALEAETN